MKEIFESIHACSTHSPHSIALQSSQSSISYSELDMLLTNKSAELRERDIKSIGIFADNSIDWAIVDLCIVMNNGVLIPIPLFFSSAQILHSIRNTGLTHLVTDQPESLITILQKGGMAYEMDGKFLNLTHIMLLNTTSVPLPSDTNKITFTSGTTGNPKGVCISNARVAQVVSSLKQVCQASTADHHVCVTPLSTLLENIGGVYLPLLAGASVCIPSLQEVGFNGSTEIDIQKLLGVIKKFDATTLILSPEMLQEILYALNQGSSTSQHLRFVAVGGAVVSYQLLRLAKQLNFPVFQGYGLSECGSVVALNSETNSKVKSVGKPLPHIHLAIASDGEILVEDPIFSGYLGGDEVIKDWPTGDIGYLDDDGYLYITGRKKTMFVTSFGRNVEPEWIESELALQEAIKQVAVFGEAQPVNIAVIYPNVGFSDQEVSKAIEVANLLLPNYAQVRKWVKANEPFSPINNQLTPNCRLKRTVIHEAYHASIEAKLEEESHAFL